MQDPVALSLVVEMVDDLVVVLVEPDGSLAGEPVFERRRRIVDGVPHIQDLDGPPLVQPLPLL
jgi:hypothetical protein